jgi:KDO2-lipid IV(A) lauroyltransferase
MKAILFYPVYFFLWLITLLPLRFLYFISDILYILVYLIGRYRSKTVFRNLRNSFPERSPAEIRMLARRFYRQLCDYFLEWVYRIHMGDEELAGRMQYRNTEILEPFRKEGKSIMLLLSHYGNWEWPTRVPIVTGYTTLAVYKELHNPYFDKLFLNLRGKFGVKGVPMSATLRSLIEHQRKGIPVVVLSLADQRPRWKNIHLWTDFLNQDTPVITGPEKIARKLGMPVVCLAINKIRRGYYEAEFRLICEDPGSVKDEFGITRSYLSMLEKDIQEKPELWLWTHNRWKHGRDSGPQLRSR